jgi:hypothetical protein
MVNCHALCLVEHSLPNLTQKFRKLKKKQYIAHLPCPDDIRVVGSQPGLDKPLTGPGVHERLDLRVSSVGGVGVPIYELTIVGWRFLVALVVDVDNRSPDHNKGSMIHGTCLAGAVEKQLPV